MKTLKTLITISLSLLILTGCGMFTKREKRDIPPQIITKWRTYDCGVPPHVDKIDFNPVVWEIIDSRYTLTTDMYANLGDNMSLIKQRTAQEKEVRQFYINCIAAAQNKSEESQ